MDGTVGHLARRGLEHIASAKEEYQMPTWGIVMLAITLIAFLLISSMIEYTFGRLVPTLLILESPSATLYEPLPLETDPAAPKNPVEPDVLLVKQQPITSSFRRTIQHLRARGGVWSRFRGLAIFLVNSFLVSTTAQFVSLIPFVPMSLAMIITTVTFSNLYLAWTHIVVSEPSAKPWYRRMPETRLWKKVAGPTAILAVSEQLAVGLPAMLSVYYGFNTINNPKQIDDLRSLPANEMNIVFWKSFSVFALTLVLGFFLVLPATVALTRVQASLLPDDQESIIPFDRSFGGKVEPEIVGGSGVLGLVDAWTSFDWNSRIRLLKAYAKVLAMQVAVAFLFFFIAVGEVILIMGKSERKEISA